MKNIIILIVIVLIAFVAYDYFTGGSLSEEEKAINLLDGEFQKAVKNARFAKRSAAVSGMDTTQELAMAIRHAEDVGKRLDELMENIESDPVFKKAEKLKATIDNFLDKNKL